MPRDMDLVRELLLRLDALAPGPTYVVSSRDEEMAVPGHDPDAIDHHLELLRSAGLIETPGSQPAAGGITFRGLTWEGDDFLDTVRDPKVWRKTKAGVSMIGGWTFSLLKEAGKAYFKQAAKDRLGLDL